MRRINLDKFLAENPPSYGVEKDELERKARRRVARLISITLASVLAVYLYDVSRGVNAIPLAIALLVVFPVFFGLGMFKVFLMFYEIEKSIPKMLLEQFAGFVIEFKPEIWACSGNRFVRFLVMKRDDGIYAFFFAFAGRLIKCGKAEEKALTMKDRVKIMLGKVEGKKRLIKSLKLEGYKFKIYEVESAILPHPGKRDAVLRCENCIEIKWSSWYMPHYINPDLLLKVEKPGE